ncbi:MAG: hypothetical protein HY300_20430, partial [Verrucomicrobia bacterium]|nr:hypothetical protein [Verrucomicrobiota bacterium]
MKNFLLAVGCALALSAKLACADESQSRIGLLLRWLETEKFETATYGELGLFDSSPNPSQYIASQRLLFKPWEHWNVGLNYTFTGKEAFDKQHDEVFTQQQRVEFQLEPHWKLSDRVTLT